MTSQPPPVYIYALDRKEANTHLADVLGNLSRAGRRKSSRVVILTPATVTAELLGTARPDVFIVGRARTRVEDLRAVRDAGGIPWPM